MCILIFVNYERVKIDIIETEIKQISIVLRKPSLACNNSTVHLEIKLYKLWMILSFLMEIFKKNKIYL